MTSLNPLHTVGRQIGETLRLHRGLNATSARAEALRLLTLVRLPEAQQKLSAYPHELSGGQRQRVMIAIALANEPRLLIADEPTTALDVTIQASILELLANLQREMGMALLLISHDLGVVRSMAQRVCVMTQGELVETGECETIFQSPNHSYTRHLLAARPQGLPVQVQKESDALLRVENLSVEYTRSKGWFGKQEVFRAVDNASFEVTAGETLGVVGESGSGKTSLGLALLRLIPGRGRIDFDGTNVAELGKADLVALRRDMQIVFQDPFGSLSPRLSVQQIIEEGLLVHERTLSPAERADKVAQALLDVGLEPTWGQRYPHEFSGGQRQRISLARAVILRPRLIVLDEPTSALDVSVQAQIVALLRDLQQRRGLSYLFISHDLNVVRTLANKLLVMKDGRIEEYGATQKLFEQPSSPYTRQLLSASLTHNVMA